MNVATRNTFGPVEAFTLGYGPLGPPLMNVTLYRVDGLLFDSGQSRMRQAALELLRGERISRILLTHHHEDHSGNAAAIGRQSGADVFGHPLTSQKMRQGFFIRPYQRLVWGPADPAAVKPLGAHVETDRYRFVPLHTPGHSADHTAYLEPHQGWLFSGDLFLGERIKFFRVDEIFHEQIASLRRVLAYDFDALFCAHNPAAGGGKAKLRAKLDFMENLGGEIRRRLAQGQGPEEIVRTLDRKRDRWVKWVTCGNASFANMVRSACRTPAASGDDAPRT
jgi:glyoxylase-like metal-dependent hydrolase (beta-lactamase superfamily II)